MLAVGENNGRPIRRLTRESNEAVVHAPHNRLGAAERREASSTIQVRHAQAVSDKMEYLWMPFRNRSDLILVQFNSANTATRTNPRVRAFNSGGRAKIFRPPAQHKQFCVRRFQ